jgi:hypothetical protein
MALYAPFDLKAHILTTLAGSLEIFSFVAILSIAVILGKFNFSSKISLTLFALFGVMMAAYMQGIYVIIILLVGITTYYALSKIGR